MTEGESIAGKSMTISNHSRAMRGNAVDSACCRLWDLCIELSKQEGPEDVGHLTVPFYMRLLKAFLLANSNYDPGG